MLSSCAREKKPINLLAIGSDRTTGDCLGPLVGEYLRHLPEFVVHGTLDTPVHAANFTSVLPRISGFTVAVDAALGNPIGGISVRRGSLAPGAAFGRDLPPVGDLAVSALVCEPGPMGFERLRSVRLNFVRQLAHDIALSLALAAGADHPVDILRLPLHREPATNNSREILQRAALTTIASPDAAATRQDAALVR